MCSTHINFFFSRMRWNIIINRAVVLIRLRLNERNTIRKKQGRAVYLENWKQVKVPLKLRPLSHDFALNIFSLSNRNLFQSITNFWCARTLLLWKQIFCIEYWMLLNALRKEERNGSKHDDDMVISGLAFCFKYSHQLRFLLMIDARSLQNKRNQNRIKSKIASGR